MILRSEYTNEELYNAVTEFSLGEAFKHIFMYGCFGIVKEIY